MSRRKKTLEEILEKRRHPIARPPAPNERPVVKHPKGWEPHVEEHGDTAVAVSQPTADPNPDEASLIAGWGFDPAEWAIDGEINARRWEANLGRDPETGKPETTWLYYYKASLVRRTSAVRASLDELVSEIKAWTPGRRPRAVPGGAWPVINLSDWQVGCGDGDGTGGTVRRILELNDQIHAFITDLRARKIPLAGALLAGMGDLGEGCSGWYPQQLFTIDLNQRDQDTVTRRLLLLLIQNLASLVPELLVVTGGGNHGENRSGSKAKGGLTDDADNRDVAVFEQVADIVAENKRLAERVSWIIPRGELYVETDATGQRLGFTHGHLADGFGKPPLNHWSWWERQLAKNPPVLDVEILNVAHRHHFIVYEPTEGRMIVQSPPLDGGSKYFRDRWGMESRAGTVAYVSSPSGLVVPPHVLPARRFDGKPTAELEQVLGRAA